jgi:hypothetical protein
MQHPNKDPSRIHLAPKITTFQIVKERKKGTDLFFPFSKFDAARGVKGKTNLSPFSGLLVEPGGIEPPTFCLQSRCSPS